MIFYCIPTPLGGAPREALPAPAITVIRSLGDFIVENAKSARAFLGALDMPVRELSIKVIGEERDPLAPLRAKRSLGLLSEAGCPAIADPGAALIEEAHREGFRVMPLVGPSSIVLALMASGLEGQRFAFCGYLPRDGADRKKRIRSWKADPAGKNRPRSSSRRPIATMRCSGRCSNPVDLKPGSASRPI